MADVKLYLTPMRPAAVKREKLPVAGSPRSHAIVSVVFARAAQPDRRARRSFPFVTTLPDQTCVMRHA